MSFLYYIAAVLCGVVLTVQIATNKQLGQHLHNLYIPATANMIIGVAATVGLTLALSKDYPSGELVRSSPWYLWLAGGVLGATYLTATILLAPKIGAGALIGLVVAGQLVFSVLVDHFGWFGFEQHGANWERVLGCALLLGGVALVSKF